MSRPQDGREACWEHLFCSVKSEPGRRGPGDVVECPSGGDKPSTAVPPEGDEGNMTMPLSKQELIRTMHAEGRSQREIARELGISRNTVAKYASKGDFSPEPPVARPRTSPTMEPYARAVRSWLEGDRDRPRKQRHTARRVYDRLVSELGYGGSLATVERFVREWRRENAHGPGEGFLELEWPCGTCQVDYGHASAVVAGEEVELHELAVSWPKALVRVSPSCHSSER